MKKLLLLAVMLFIAAFSFAQEEERPESPIKKREFTDPIDPAPRPKTDYKKYNTDYIKTMIGYAKPYGIVVNGYSYVEKNGLDTFYISFMNLTKGQTIKYVWITVDAINPVDDIVCTKTLRAIGPIEYSSHGRYVFDNEFISYRTIDHIKISGIKIQFMDGIFKEVPKPKLKFILQENDFDWGNYEIN